MARLIDADALRYDLCVSNCSAYEICGTQCRTIRIINEQPTIAAEPVRHGRWIEDGEVCGIDKYKCSICGGEVGGLLDNTKYCCFCGAEMEGGAENG